MIKLHPTSHRIETAFILALFTMFAATAFLVVLIGAKQYQSTADSMNKNYEIRTAASYLEEKARSNDNSGSIYVTELMGLPALAFQNVEDDITYITYIYYYDNYLRELFVSDSSVYSLESGQEIIEINGFDVEIIKPDLICATYIGTDNLSYPVYLHVHASGGKEAL